MQDRLKALLAATGLAAMLAVGPALVRPAAASDTIVVQAGDTLSAIAVRNGVSIERLVELNRLSDPNRIYAGQTLRLRGSRGEAAQHTAAPRRHDHLVAAGETLTGIAQRYGTTINALASANHIANPSRIFAGQTLRIPGSAPAQRSPSSRASAPRAAARSRSVAYSVQPGDTLTGIAARFGTSVAAIAQANRILNPSYVRAGDVLRIPIARGDGSRPRTSRAAMPPSMASLVASRRSIGAIIAQEARRYGVPIAFAQAVAWQESGWQPGVRSYAGAVGVMQLLPATADWVGSTMLGQDLDIHDTRHNVRGGVRLLRHYLDRYGGDKARALAAYYQGQTAVDRYGIFSVSRPYIASIQALERVFR